MAMTAFPVYPVGTPGQPWGDAEREQWRALQTKKRDYFTDVLSSLLRFRGGDVFQYGTLDYRSYGAASYPLFAVKSSGWDAKKPMVLVTGGVHGYETSGVHGALLFVHQHLQSYSDRVNVLVLPCVSPWGYETINRWTPAAVDPNRCFTPKEPGCPEAAAAMKTIAEHVAQSSGILMHTDLHETTDTDNSEFTPAKTARDGIESPPFEPIPDGFYLVADSERVALGFHKALIAAVAKVTHIAPADEKGTILGDALEAEGIVSCTARSIGLCGGHTDAVNTTTTEVYPDSAKTDAETCNRAQVAAVVAGIEYSLAEAQSKTA